MAVCAVNSAVLKATGHGGVAMEHAGRAMLRERAAELAAEGERDERVRQALCCYSVCGRQHYTHTRAYRHYTLFVVSLTFGLRQGRTHNAGGHTNRHTGGYTVLAALTLGSETGVSLLCLFVCVRVCVCVCNAHVRLRERLVLALSVLDSI